MRFLSRNLKHMSTILAFISGSGVGSVFAEPSYEPIINYHSSSIFAQVGSPVGRLKIKTTRGNFYCTGFLVSEKYLITNEHCVDESWYDKKTKKTIPRTVKKLTLELGYIDPASKSVTAHYNVVLPPLERNETLDYAILEVEGNPSGKFGYLAISNVKPIEKMPLWIIGHPGGKAQQISRIRCRSVRQIKRFSDRIQHTCPAVAGSSGSPVFDASTGAVIGIHHASLTSKKLKVGLAVPISIIAKQSSLLRSIINGQ